MRTPVIAHLIAALVHRFDVWKAREDLRRLDDHLLSDIGLRRSEIDRAVSRPSEGRSRVVGTDRFSLGMGRTFAP